MATRISLAEIARHTGFAVPTVSMALRNVGTVGHATKEKIQEAARMLGYYPNPLLAALASKHFSPQQTAGTPLAFIHAPVGNSTDEAIARGAIKAGQEYGRRMGYRMDLFEVDEFKDGEEATRILYSRGIQGIVLGNLFESKMLPGMDWGRFSVVGWGESLSESPDSVQPSPYRAAIDHFGLVVRAWEETWKRGYRRIGFALFNRSSSADDRLRWGAVQTCLQDVPRRSCIPPFIHKPQPEDREAPRKLTAWVRRYRPDAIIGFNAWIRLILLENGFRVPEDIGFVTLHKMMDAGIHPVPKTPESGMKDMKYDSMLAALELLDQQIRHHQSGLPREPRTLMVRSEWVEGETLPRKPSRPNHPNV